MKAATYKKVSLLFKFRNALVHGNKPTFRYEIKNPNINEQIKIDYSGYEGNTSYKEIIEYLLVEAKIITISDKGSHIIFLNDPVVIHFLEGAESFIDELINTLPNKEKKELSKKRRGWFQILKKEKNKHISSISKKRIILTLLGKVNNTSIFIGKNKYASFIKYGDKENSKCIMLPKEMSLDDITIEQAVNFENYYS